MMAVNGDAEHQPSSSEAPVGARFHLVRTLEGHRAAVSCLKFEPRYGHVLLSGSSDQTVRLWRHETGDVLFTGTGHEGGLNDVHWIGKGDHFCTASDDKSIGVWDAEAQKLLHRCTGHTNFVFSVKSNERGDMLVTGSFDETIRLWDVRSGNCVREIPAHGDPLTSVDISPDGSFIVSGSYDGLCRIWNVMDGRAVKTIVSKDCSPVSNVQFTPNGIYLLIATLNNRLTLKKHIYNSVTASNTVMEYVGHANDQLCLVPTFTFADGTGGHRWLVCGSEDGALCVWSIRKPKRTSTGGHSSSNGATAATREQTCCQKVPGRRSAESEGDGHCDAVLYVHSHPKQPTVATGAKEKDCSIKIWTDCVT